MKIIIVGGVAGGATVATKLRRNNENDEIIVFEKDEHVSFANCGLPYHIGNVIRNRERLIIRTVEDFKTIYDIEVRNNTEVIKIDEVNKVIYAKKNEEIYSESYDKLILSPGAKNFNPGLEASNLFSLRNIADMDRIKSYIDTHKVLKAVVLGGGFVGMEIAENLSHLDIEITIVDKHTHILNAYDIEMAAIIETNLKANGTILKLNTTVKKLDDKKIELANGEIIDTDLTILAIGIQPLTDLAKNTNIELTPRGAFKVNNKFETSVKDIYALGDAIEVYSPIIDKMVYIPLAGPTNRQAGILGDIINGADVTYHGSYGARIIKINDLSAGSIGFSSEFLKQHNIKHEQLITHLTTHAGYYPKSTPIALKVVFDKETKKILGAQVIGGDGTDKRIDVIATAMQLGVKIDQLPSLELAYSPPYNNVKDPINILGSIATNIIHDKTNMASFDQISEFKNIIDVRMAHQFKRGNIEGSINIPIDDLRVTEIPFGKDEPILIYCRVGFRGYLAEQILRTRGYKHIYNLSGGYLTYATYIKNKTM